MIKLGDVKFNDEIVDAIQNETLVIFAGAGVSMGAPSSLPDFNQLVKNIAEIKDQYYQFEVALDRFLGELDHKKVPVHDRAIKCLKQQDSYPTELHKDLTKIFGSCDRIRIITTNFDLHFENASKIIFGGTPEIFCAPALPLGRQFRGIVHVHGAVTRSDSLVLTDSDFGRAYLTEGWARRFLVDVFRNFTVLFVGYSHDDMVMNYLARALPSDKIKGRYVLTDSIEKWSLLGITPIEFKLVDGENKFIQLNNAIKKFAEWSNRGVLDWKFRISEIARNAPPLDEEAVREIEHAFCKIHTVRFFTSVAEDTNWPRWLNVRKVISPLFGQKALSECELCIADWLVHRYLFNNSDVLIDLITENGFQLNPEFWMIICRFIGYNSDDNLDVTSLKRWILILLSAMPSNNKGETLRSLAEKCNEQKCIEEIIQIFFKMTQYQLQVKPAWSQIDDVECLEQNRKEMRCEFRSNYEELNQVWSEYLRPHLNRSASDILSCSTQILNAIHHDLTVWNNADRDWDPISYGRSAIELHEQDRFPESVDVVIDSVRDCLEWFGDNDQAILKIWVDHNIQSDSPILRRLAIHANTFYRQISSDNRLMWILKRTELNSFSEHHEIFRAIAHCYATASDKTRLSVIKKIRSIKEQAFQEWSQEKYTSYTHFNWFSWLLKSKPDCDFARMALEPIAAIYPDWKLSNMADFTSWSGPAEIVIDQSPWTVDQMIAKHPEEQIKDLLEYNENSAFGLNRRGLRAVVKRACIKNHKWGFLLADVLKKEFVWDSDLWVEVIDGLTDSNLDLHNWRKLLSIVEQVELQTRYPGPISNLLFRIVKDNGLPFATEILDYANAVSRSLWNNLNEEENIISPADWFTRAINQSSGIIVEFWVLGLSLKIQGLPESEKTILSPYIDLFSEITTNNSSKCHFGRAILASQTAFLLSIDDVWTTKHIIPQFSNNNQFHFQQAWDGFLAGGNLTASLFEVLIPCFTTVFEMLGDDVNTRRRNIVQFSTKVAFFYSNDPEKDILKPLLESRKESDLEEFSDFSSRILLSMEQEAVYENCDRWLLEYWAKRSDAIPLPLSNSEMCNMLDWLPSLGKYFPKGLEQVHRFPKLDIRRGQLLYRLKDSELIDMYPNEMAALLIYLCDCTIDFHTRYLQEIASKLSSIKPELRKKLDTALALKGIF